MNYLFSLRDAWWLYWLEDDAIKDLLTEVFREQWTGKLRRILAARGLISPRTRWYAGRPVMVTANDYGLKLFNGDVGIILPDRETDGAPRAFFAAHAGATAGYMAVLWWRVLRAGSW